MKNLLFLVLFCINCAATTDTKQQSIKSTLECNFFSAPEESFDCLNDPCVKDSINSQQNTLIDFCSDQPYICPRVTSKPFMWDSDNFWKVKFNYRQWVSTKSNGTINNYIYYVYDLPFTDKHLSIWTKVDIITYVIGAEIIDRDWSKRDLYGLVPCRYLKGQLYYWL